MRKLKITLMSVLSFAAMVVCFVMGQNRRNSNIIMDSNIEALTYSWEGQHIKYWIEYATGQFLPDCSPGTCGWVGRCTNTSFSDGLMAYCKISKEDVNRYRDANNYVVHNWCCDSCSSTTYCGMDD